MNNIKRTPNGINGLDGFFDYEEIQLRLDEKRKNEKNREMKKKYKEKERRQRNKGKFSKFDDYYED